jgi:hypothetical protein
MAGGSHGPVVRSWRSASSLVRLHFRGSGQAGLDDREVGEAVEGAPAATGSALLHLGAPARSAAHRPQVAGAHTTISSGSATCRSVKDSAPGCLPRFRPLRPRSDRSRGFFLSGLSDDGGLDDVPESLPRRRSSSATRSPSAAGISSPPGPGGRSGTSHHDQPARIALITPAQ